jgi:lipoprotein-anchoring transpeptidase ErfK/SrfK
MIRASGHGAPVVSGRLWQIMVLTAAAAIGSASQAEAALYYWDADPGYYRPGPTVPQRRPKVRRQAKKIEPAAKESAKPQGPLIIAISINKQQVKIYDANGFFAEAPVSTGMKGHPTPMGAFSIIQKHKFHHSNIYSGAPMPYMQRITWSGVAMHAGVLPGYPASHGCIRMPMAFAVKMWNWTKMGARVVITPGEMTPAPFSHPLLATHKVVPQPTAANEPPADAPPAAKANKAANEDATPKFAVSEASLELRSTTGHNDGVKSATDEPSAPAPLRDQTRTADASSDMRATKVSITMSDTSSSASRAPAREEASAATESAPQVTTDAVSVKNSDASNAEANSEAATSEAEPADAKHDEVASSDEKPAETKSAETAATEIKSAASDNAGKKTDETQAPAQASAEVAQAEAPATGSVKSEAKLDEKKTDTKEDNAKVDALKPDAPKSSEKPEASVKAVTDTSPGVAANKDQARLPDAEKPAAVSKPDPATSAAPKRTGQIAVFVSRKDSKLYVRQNFSPLFEAPVTIAPSDRLLGTHVFTAQVDKNDANVLHWSVVSLPVPARRAERHDEDDRASRRRKIAGVVEMKPMPMSVPDSPAEALDRLTIPADVMARIVDALSTGSSIIVSDQGISAGETGEGTDFIVSLR